MTEQASQQAIEPPSHRSERLSPWPVRVVVFAVMAAVALGAIRLIDQRAMVLMTESGNEAQAEP